MYVTQDMDVCEDVLSSAVQELCSSVPSVHGHRSGSEDGIKECSEMKGQEG